MWGCASEWVFDDKNVQLARARTNTHAHTRTHTCTVHTLAVLTLVIDRRHQNSLWTSEVACGETTKEKREENEFTRIQYILITFIIIASVQ